MIGNAFRPKISERAAARNLQLDSFDHFSSLSNDFHRNVSFHFSLIIFDEQKRCNVKIGLPNVNRAKIGKTVIELRSCKRGNRQTNLRRIKRRAKKENDEAEHSKPRTRRGKFKGKTRRACGTMSLASRQSGRPVVIQMR